MMQLSTIYGVVKKCMKGGDKEKVERTARKRRIAWTNQQAKNSTICRLSGWCTCACGQDSISPQPPPLPARYITYDPDLLNPIKQSHF